MIESALTGDPMVGAETPSILYQALAIGWRHPSLRQHCCPRRMLGARMGLYGGTILGLSLPQAVPEAVGGVSGWVGGLGAEGGCGDKTNGRGRTIRASANRYPLLV